MRVQKNYEELPNTFLHNLALIEHLHTSENSKACVGGIVASIAAFQAVDPGSIPGQRNK